MQSFFNHHQNGELRLRVPNALQSRLATGRP